jgi:hypothetical protein
VVVQRGTLPNTPEWNEAPHPAKSTQQPDDEEEEEEEDDDDDDDDEDDDDDDDDDSSPRPPYSSHIGNMGNTRDKAVKKVTTKVRKDLGSAPPPPATAAAAPPPYHRQPSPSFPRQYLEINAIVSSSSS